MHIMHKNKSVRPDEAKKMGGMLVEIALKTRWNKEKRPERGAGEAEICAMHIKMQGRE